MSHPGRNNRITKIRLYAIDTRELIQVAAHNPRLFDPDSKQPRRQRRPTLAPKHYNDM